MYTYQHPLNLTDLEDNLNYTIKRVLPCLSIFFSMYDLHWSLRYDTEVAA